MSLERDMFMVAVSLWHGMVGSMRIGLEMPGFMPSWHLVIGCKGSQHSVVHIRTLRPP